MADVVRAILQASRHPVMHASAARVGHEEMQRYHCRRLGAPSRATSGPCIDLNTATVQVTLDMDVGPNRFPTWAFQVDDDEQTCSLRMPGS